MGDASRTTEITDGLVFDPQATAWPVSLTPPDAESDAGRARAAAGLPVGRPIVMSGHQAGVWHAGILAKRFALDAAAARYDAAGGWLIADQDTNDPGALAYPRRGENGRLVRTAVSLPGESRVPGETPSGCQPRLVAADAPEATEAVPTRLAEALDTIVSTPGETAASQSTAANEALLRTRTGVAIQPILSGLMLARMPAFGAWVAMMRGDAAGCTAAYNAAAEAVPAARIKPLVCRPEVDRIELPLWRVRRGEARRPVYSVQIDDIDPAELAPRAIVLTAFVRAMLCDLFIHGTGGAVYDAVAERWAASWLGVPLAPKVAVTATLRLDLGVEPATTEDVSRAKWRAHHARHDPEATGDAEAAATKRGHIEAIRSAKANGEDPAPQFKAMHAALQRYRAKSAEMLARLDAEARDAEERLADSVVALDRTWPWVLHDDGALRRLRVGVHHAIEAGVRT